MCIVNVSKGAWNSKSTKDETEGSDSSYGGYDGEESVSELVDDVFADLSSDLGNNEEGINVNLFKRTLGYGR